MRLAVAQKSLNFSLVDDIIKHAEKVVKKSGVVFYEKDSNEDESGVDVGVGMVNGIRVTDEEEVHAHDCFIAILYEVSQHGSNIRKNLLQV